MPFHVAMIAGVILWFVQQPLQAEDELAACRRLAPKYHAVAEHRLWDGTRVDLLNDEYAIEADWSHKHYEAFGQATWYSIVTGKKPAVLLLVKDKEKEAQHIYRATAIAVRLNVTLYVEPSME